MRIVLCDDNLLLGEALAPALTASGHQIAAITTSLTAGLAAIRAHRPDACLLGLRFSGEEGLFAIRAIMQRHPGTAVVMLARAADPALAWQARKLGVAGFLSKNSNVAQITEALDVVAGGGSVFEPALPSRPPAVASRRSQPVYELTPREHEVLRRIVEGQGPAQLREKPAQQARHALTAAGSGAGQPRRARSGDVRMTGAVQPAERPPLNCRSRATAGRGSARTGR
jgi:DNA-binding NarL/FixJ family response regulator